MSTRRSGAAQGASDFSGGGDTRVTFAGKFYDSKKCPMGAQAGEAPASAACGTASASREQCRLAGGKRRQRRLSLERRQRCVRYASATRTRRKSRARTNTTLRGVPASMSW